MYGKSSSFRHSNRFNMESDFTRFTVLDGNAIDGGESTYEKMHAFWCVGGRAQIDLPHFVGIHVAGV